MNLSSSSFYYRPKAKEPDRVEAGADLRDRIEAICLEFPRYGYRRVTHQLKYERRAVNHKKVLRFMRESDLLCRVKHKWIATTNSNHRFPVYPNLIRGWSLAGWTGYGYQISPISVTGRALSTWQRYWTPVPGV